jgi:predicted nuclease of predicted toxin-antitoxin system
VQPSFYADEDFDFNVVQQLRLLGYDVLTVQEAGERGADDARVLQRATQEGRCVLTFNRSDFELLHRQDPSHAGIISCSRDKDRAALTDRIHQKVLAEGILGGKHVRVNRT